MSEFCELTYGEVLRELRTYHDYKQKDISSYLNITSQAYSNYENNKRTPDIETVRKIAEFYNITVDTLIGYRYTSQIEDSRDYAPLYRGVSHSGITIPLSAKQARFVTDFIALPLEQQEACQKFIEFIK